MVSLSISGAYAQETLTIDAPTDDSSVFEARPDLNRGDADYLYVGVGPYSTYGYPARTWVKFDLSSIPDGVVITKAELRLYFEWSWGSGAPGGIEVHFSSDDTWNEMEITWNNQPSFEGTPTDMVPQFDATNCWVSFDVTSDVISEYSGDKVVSWCLCAVNEEEGGGKNFNTADSKENPPNRPYLYIEYQTSGFVIPEVPFGTATIIALAVLAFGTMVLLSKRRPLRHITPQ